MPIGPIMKFFPGFYGLRTLLITTDVSATLVFVVLYDLRVREDGDFGSLINVSLFDHLGLSFRIPSYRLKEVHLFSQLHELFIPEVFLLAITPKPQKHYV